MLHYNTSTSLPPVNVKFVIRFAGEDVTVIRDSHIKRKSDDLEYRLIATDEIITGRYEWRYM